MSRAGIMAEIHTITAAMAQHAVRLDYLDHATPPAGSEAVHQVMTKQHRDALAGNIKSARAYLGRLEEACRA